MLDWPKWYQTILALGRGLLYLYEESLAKIIHKDIKASKVLLNNNLNPEISDFGMAMLFLEHAAQVNTFRISGTDGYIAPEYAMHGYLDEDKRFQLWDAHAGDHEWYRPAYRQR